MELQLDPSQDGLEGNTHSSLTDLNRLGVFYNSFEEATQTKKEEETARQQDLEKELFAGKITEQNDGWLYSRLFTDSQEMTVHRTPPSAAVTELPSWAFPAAASVIMVCVILVLQYHYMRRKQRKKVLMEQTLELQHNIAGQDGYE